MPNNKAPAIHELKAHNIYLIEDVMAIFKLPRSGVRREIRLNNAPTTEIAGIVLSKTNPKKFCNKWHCGAY